MIGVGYLTLPANCKQTGLILCILAVIVCNLGSLLGSYFLSKAYTIIPSDSYPQLTRRVLGRRHYLFLTTVVIFYTMFSTTMYIYFGQVLLTEVLSKFGLPRSYWTDFAAKTGMFVVSTILSITKVDNIKWVSYTANIFSFFTAIVLIIQAPMFLEKMPPRPLKYFEFNINFFPALGACFFAFTNQFGIITIIKSLRGGGTKDTLSVG